MVNRSYQSDTMQFINTLLNKPGNHEQQMKLRSTWWDKDAAEVEFEQQLEKSEIKHDAYVYFTYHPTKK